VQFGNSLRITLACCALASSGCGGDELDMGAVGRLDYHGRVERIETLGRYTTTEAVLLFNASGARSKGNVENDYYLYRVIYPTENVDGDTTTVSGLVALPATRRMKGVLAWQHGTNTYRPNSISKPSLPEGLGISAVFAGDGYLVAAADYIGLGVSTEPQAYYHWPSTVSTVVDLLSIAKMMLDGLAEAPDDDLYLAGFSQGGGASAAIQRSLEQDNPTGLTLRGNATIAAAFDPLAISLANTIEHSDTFYLALIAESFARLYGGSLADVVQAPYAEKLPSWFDGTHDGTFLEAHIPARVEDLVTPEFLAGYEEGLETPAWFYEGLRAATLSDFAPRAPLRIHYGNTDTTVSPAEARAGFERMRDLGGNVEVVDMGAFDHENIVVASLPYIQQWFDGLERHEP
jgi:dienelactone hydrolase